MRALRRAAVVMTFALSLCVAATALADGSVTYQVDPQHTGALDSDTLTPPLGVLWAWDLGGPSSYPIVAAGKVFVTSRDASQQGYGTTLYAFDAQTGTIAWSRPIAGTYYWSTMAYEGGKLFVINFDGVLRAFDASSGASLWGKQMPGQYAFSSPPSPYNGVVYLGGAGSGGTVYAVRESDGAVLWTGSVMNGDDSSPAVDSSGMYVNYACNQAYGFTLTGALKWHHDSSCEGGGGATPVLYGGKVWIRDGGADLVLDAANGSEVGAFASGAPPVFSGGLGIFLSGGTLEAERLSDGVPLWSFKGDGGLGPEPLLDNGVVYAASSQGNLFGIARDSGSLVWSDCLPGAASGSGGATGPTMGMGAGDGMLVVPGARYLVAYESRPGAQSYACSGTQPSGPVQLAGGAPAGGSAGGGAGTTGAPSSGGVAGVQSSSVTLKPGRRSIVFGRAVTLSGRAAPGASVELRADPFPFGAFAPVASTTAASDGTFSFRVKPDRNTAFKAASNGVESPATVVYVDVGGSLLHKRLRTGRTRVASTVVGPKDLPYGGKTLWFYAIAKDGKTARRIGSRRLKGRAGVFNAALTTPVSVRHYAVCAREPKPDAWGRALAVDRVCGARRLKLP